MHRMTKKPGKKKKREHIWAPVLISTSNSELIRVWVWIMKSCFLFGSKYGKSKWWGLRKVSNITAKKRFGSGAHTMRFTLFLTHSETSTIIVPHIYKLLLLWALFLMTVCLWLRLSGLHLASDPNHMIQSTALYHSLFPSNSNQPSMSLLPSIGCISLYLCICSSNKKSFMIATNSHRKSFMLATTKFDIYNVA